MATVSLPDPLSSPGAPQLSDPALSAPRLQLPGYDLEVALRLERELGLSHVISQILVRRGYTEPGAVQSFLAADQRHDPSLFAGIDAALE